MTRIDLFLYLSFFSPFVSHTPSYPILSSSFIQYSFTSSYSSPATDYVPKVSKALLPPARIAIAGMCGITFVGLSVMSVASPGGIKGCVKGLWNPTPKDEKK